MQGIIDEFATFRAVQPNACVLPVLSTGGAVLSIYDVIPPEMNDLQNDLDYVRLFHKRLRIDVREQRYRTPELQPAVIRQRLWRPDSRSPPNSAS